MNRDPRITAYVERQASFARPILERFREAVHVSCPEGDYDAWVLEAKRSETRAKRVAQAVAWMAEGKKRNWKYERC